MMHQRGGFPTKALIYAVFVVLMVYMVYIYHGSQSQLRESEMSGSRFKREAEERVTEINELVKAKDRAEETCRSEKSELNTRIKSINQQHSLLQSQYKETEADFIKLQKDMETIKSEHAQAESAHAQEFERLKQEKELDIAQLKDEIADLKRKNTALESSISSLREKIKNNENAQKALMDENGRLQQQLQTKQQLPGKDSQGVPQQQFQNQDVHKQPLQNNFQNLQFGGNNQQDVARIPGTGLVKNMQINDGKFNEGKFNNLQTLGQGAGQLGGQNADQNKADGFVQLDSLKNEIDQARPQVQDFNNDARQVQPPLNNDEFNNDDNNKDDDDENKETDLKDEDIGLNNKIEFRPQVNPNDEQSNQILGPNLDNFDKQQGGGEAGVERMNVRGAEEARENGVKEEAEEDGLLQHKNPLALGQIEVPGAGDGQRGWENPEEGRAGQQMPPLLKEEDEQDNGGINDVRRVINPVAPGL